MKKEVGDVSILINNAGIVTGRKFMDCPDELIEKSLDVNFKAHIWVSIFSSHYKRHSQVALVVKNSPASAGDIRDMGSIPGSGRSLEKETATHSSILAWIIPRTEEPGGLQSMGPQRVGHD